MSEARAEKLAMNELYGRMCTDCGRRASYAVELRTITGKSYGRAVSPFCWRHLKRFLKRIGVGEPFAVTITRR